MRTSYLLSLGLVAAVAGCGEAAENRPLGSAAEDADFAPSVAEQTPGDVAQDLPRRPQRPLTIGPRAEELARMQAFVNERVDPADIVSQYVEDDGTAVDCVKIEAQPALRNARARGHKIATPPSANLAPRADDGLRDPGPGCPANAVPIRRISYDEVARYRSLDEYFQRSSRKSADDANGSDLGSSPSTRTEGRTAASSTYEYAYGKTTGRFEAIEANFQLFAPYAERNDHSLAQIWAVSTNPHETVEVGINANHRLYSDWGLHWFIYSEDFLGRGCYNNDCGDFVQVSPNKRPGARFTTVSVDGGAQYTCDFRAEQDSNGSWWIRARGEWVGYYIASFFNAPGLRDYANVAEFGGEVMTLDNSPHTATDMGTGSFPSAGWTHASFIANIATRTDGTVNFTSPTLTPIKTRAECYNVAIGPAGTSWGTYLYYGGSGRNPQCQ